MTPEPRRKKLCGVFFSFLNLFKFSSEYFKSHVTSKGSALFLSPAGSSDTLLDLKRREEEEQKPSVSVTLPGKKALIRPSRTFRKNSATF